MSRALVSLHSSKCFACELPKMPTASRASVQDQVTASFVAGAACYALCTFSEPGAPRIIPLCKLHYDLFGIVFTGQLPVEKIGGAS
jgi:hypothetical protein